MTSGLKLVCLFLCYILVIAGFSFAGNQVGVVKVEEGSSLRVREYASLDAEVLTAFKPGTEAIVKQGLMEGLGHDWYCVIAPNGQERWVAGDYLGIQKLSFSFAFTESERFAVASEKLDIPINSSGLGNVRVELFPADRSYTFKRNPQHRKAVQEKLLNQFAYISLECSKPSLTTSQE